tara:strand:- start:3504 stop:4508 length:1005 start_codon:yes stop_codon:yes gene_type:complete
LKYLNSLNNSLFNLLSKNDDLFIIGQDIKDPYGGAFKVTKNLSKNFPNKVLNMPISESGIIGFATGLVLNKNKVISEIMFSDFLTLCSDQIINHASKFNYVFGKKIIENLIIRTPSGAYRGYGPTHSQSMESIFFNIPGLNIYSPNLFIEPGKLLEKIFFDLEGPTLFIEHKLLYPKELIFDTGIFKKIKMSNEFETLICNPNYLANNECLIISYGYLSEVCFKIIKDFLYDREKFLSLLVKSDLKNFVVNDVLEKLILKTKKVLIIEESYENNGWSSEISYQIQSKFRGKNIEIFRLGNKNLPIPNSINNEIENLPTYEKIEKELIKILSENE